MNQPVVSIIVPVYKAEKYLFRCVDSILNQTFKDWECILVDDGSPDGSGSICDTYAQNDKRIKVIHKKNGGVSSARQAGLETVVGEFVIHVDSDDWLDPNMLEELVRHQKETGADLIIFDFYRLSNGNQIIIHQKPTALDNVQVLKDIISGRLYASCWNKLVKHSMIDKYNASFPKGINLGEDKCFLASLLKHTVVVSYLPQPLYYYDAAINENSLVRNISKSSMDSGFAMVSYLEAMLGEEFCESIFNIKRNIKLRAVSSGLYSGNEVRNMYKEINTRIIFNTIALKTHSKDDIILCLYCLKQYRLARYLYNKMCEYK